MLVAFSTKYNKKVIISIKITMTNDMKYYLTRWILRFLLRYWKMR